MVQPDPESYQVDPADPRAPPQELWDLMTPAKRANVQAMLDGEEARRARLAPQEDLHRKEELIAKLGAMLDDALAKKQAAEEGAASVLQEIASLQQEAARVPALQQELAEARVEIERLKRDR